MTETDTHTQRERERERKRERESLIFDEKGADEQGSLLTDAEKSTSGVDTELAARTENDTSWRFRQRCVPGIILWVNGTSRLQVDFFTFFFLWEVVFE